MRRLLTLLLLTLSLVLLATVYKIPVKAGEVEVPIVIKMSDLLSLVPEDFDADWSALHVVSGNAHVPFQIDDADGNGRISAGDYLVFLLKDQGEIVIPDADENIEVPKFEPKFDTTKTDDGWTITSKDGSLKLRANKHGLAQVIAFKGVEKLLLDEIGIARVSGWPESTYWVDGKLGNHHEETTGSFRIVSVNVFKPGPVAVGIHAHLKSERFHGLNQILLVYVFANGDILVNNTFKFESYADMMKLQTMVTRPLVPAFDDALHILPVFRRLVWADQLNITPLEYWKMRNAIIYVDETPYIAFPATSSMKPLWWGATYIFASMERWRSNYSPNAKIGVAQILPFVPVVHADYKKWLDSDTWVYESLEFRDGIFKWMPGEFDAYESTRGIYSMKVEDMPNRYKFGDSVSHLRLLSLYSAPNIESAVKWIETKSASFRSVKVGE
ncbi:hypothetical protein AJ81_05960 [Pseudothermotoga hypogea DSM 11164 = NBRC 106472]|uniref:EF-hand domain-containing protein n=1 Tax=Pseudothermotoga hypogea DSM 11164 = NBRC 106472 TaxID=1123384 RepID=A0A0X1KRD5_9THEM|nr:MULTISPECIES: hypothetical protein [Pseudothermotoga]AJC73813.1 hypothetical protein AJ81_05960 [Pseudothermotoga hypogea DSM 11164 = NBRC 106472]MDI6863235.1 hypothetical protein [Pseudothermotoga sp.]